MNQKLSIPFSSHARFDEIQNHRAREINNHHTDINGAVLGAYVCPVSKIEG